MGLYKNIGGTLTQVSTITNNSTVETGLTASVNVIASGTNIIMQVAGTASQTQVWDAVCTVVTN